MGRGLDDADGPRPDHRMPASFRGGGARTALLGCAPVDARTFLGMEPDGDDLHWHMRVTPQLTTPGNFLFGGCGLGAALVALEVAAGRPAVWATAQYLSYALTDAELYWEVVLAAEGRHVTQGRAVGRVDGREILTVNAALGRDDLDVGGVWVAPPEVPPPDQCPGRFLPELFRNTIMDSIEVLTARGLTFEEMDGRPGDPDSALWARVPGHLAPSAATLAIMGDYVSGAVSQPLGRRAMGRSLDNTLRMVQLKPTEWVLCDIRMHALVDGYAQGIAFLWSSDGELLATASQSIAVRLWPENGLPGR
jgi:acyl-CoA thioesterase II